MKIRKKKQTIAAIMLFAAVMTLVILPITSVVGIQLPETMKSGGSPLYHIRTKNAIREKLEEARESFRATFIGEKVLISLPLLRFLRRSDTSITAVYTESWSCCGKVQL